MMTVQLQRLRATTETPATEPAAKKHKADKGGKSIQNCHTTLETRWAKCKLSLQVLRKHAVFQTALDQISHRAHRSCLPS